ncbi:MAG: hypothetical protein Q7T53_04945 [Deltaproteobacteria bacterium]|nr:hypothetical protein [Deltaproteobacteria bacterium]
MKRIKTYLLTLTISLIVTNVWAKDVSFTLEDRDRLIRMETSLKEFKESVDKRFEQIDKRFEQVDRRIERVEGVMMWGFGLLFTSMLGMVGFVLWDRRTAVAPVARILREKEEDIEELKKRERAIIDAMRDYAAGDQRLAGILKARGLL